MPFRLNEWRTKIQFTAPAWMPATIYRAVVATGVPSNARYINVAVCEALARDLNLDLNSLLAELPPTRGMNGHPFGPDRQPIFRTGPANTHEKVK